MLTARHFTAILIFLSSVSYAQKAKVSGTITGLKEPVLIFNHAVGDSTRNDTVKVKNGNFTWEAAIPNPEKVNIFFPDRVIELFAEGGHIQIKGRADSLGKLKITGSKTQDEADAFERSLKDITEEEMLLYKKYDKGGKEEQIALEAKLDQLKMKRHGRADQYIAVHPKSAFSLSLVSDRATMGDYDEVKTIYDLLDPSVQKTVIGKQLSKRLVVLKRSSLGEQMLDFTQNNLEGTTIRFSNFKGKYILVDFWASWCHPCRAENPNVLKAYNKYKDKNFTVIGVSLDDNGDRWRKAVKDDNMPWAQVSDLRGWDNEVSFYYGIQAIPGSLLIDPQGRIIARNLRGDALNKKLAELFGG